GAGNPDAAIRAYERAARHDPDYLPEFLPSLLGITVASYMTDLIQMLPYVVTIVVLIVVSLRKKKENQPPEHLGLSYFREER
ncbi:MAG TPA: hypothetical protein PLL85_00520, partial [Gemmiger qucibialis]|nr:hypothetical protein [Gemmiger qucibialis]